MSSSPPETQSQRRLKYGANVALTVVVAVVLAVVVAYLAGRFNKRVDTTFARAYSLKPQTLQILKDLKDPVKIVSLYTRTRAEGQADYAGPVADLLQEYKRNGEGIEVEEIDPITQKSKVDDLINDVTNRYGGEVKKYRDFLDAYPKTFEQIKQVASGEVAAVASLPFDQITNQELAQTVVLAIATVQEFPKLLEEGNERTQRRLKLKPPDYKGATDGIRDNIDSLSAMTGQIIDSFKKSKDDPKIPEPIRKYMADSLGHYAELKKLADKVSDDIKNLGELKLDSLRESLREQDTILVLGKSDLKKIAFDDVWQVDKDLRTALAGGNKLKPSFAGEQQVSTAILSLSAATKPKVVFMRPGGAPLTTQGIPGFRQGGPLSSIANRLRSYNFEVLEKDLSGQWSMQAQMRGMPPEPEPTDEDVRNAVWIVLSFPQQRQMQMPMPPLGPKVKEHLDRGGSALLMFLPGSDDLSDALKDWGVTVHTDMLAVHERVDSAGATGDIIDEAQRVPYIFVTNKYGDHPLVKPLRSLDALIVPTLVIEIASKPGFKGSPLLPVPESPKSWGEKDMEAALSQEGVKFEPDKGDLAQPIYGGAAVEKDGGGGRLVALGSVEFVTNRLMNMPDPEMARRGIPVARFPGNAELLVNSVFWLSKMDTMIAISPNAMDVSRIKDMSPAALNFVRVGVLIVGLPGMVIASGLFAYFRRRD